MTLEEIEETEILIKFRDRVKDLQQSDETLLRFLKARNLHLQNAETMLRNSIQWRKANDLDNILNWKINKELSQKLPVEFPGMDHENRTVVYLPLGTWNMREMIQNGYKDEMLRIIYFRLETIVQETVKTGDKFTLICDLAGITYWKIAHYETVQLSLKMFSEFEANYPERLAQAMVLNVPYFVNFIWNLLKPLLTGNTLSKVTFLGSNEKEYIPKLLEQLPESSLPVRLRDFLE